MFLRSKDNEPDIGESVSLANMWTLSKGWYGDRLAEPFQPKTINQLQDLLSDAGLTSDFWQL